MINPKKERESMESTKDNMVEFDSKFVLYIYEYEIINEAASHAFSKFEIKAERELGNTVSFLLTLRQLCRCFLLFQLSFVQS